ncbi:putative nuclease HARBI1 [Gastrophryne carolinensis]
MAIKRCDPTTGLSQAIPGIVRLCASLNILAQGTFQATAALLSGISQVTMSCIFYEAVLAICDLLPLYIRFSKGAGATHKVSFLPHAGIPNVLGCLPFCPPTIPFLPFHECDCGLRSDFPGSFHNSYVLQQSALCWNFENNEMPAGWLLVDKGYGQKTWLMTPVRDTQTASEVCYNAAYHKTRCTVERTIGLLKACFLCLAYPGGEMLYSPEKVSKIILACCILHNIRICHRMEEPKETALVPEVPNTPAEMT